MAIKTHPHAAERMRERGTNAAEVEKTIETGERFPAKFGRTGFRRNFPFDGIWNEKNIAPNKLKSLPSMKMTIGLQLQFW
jgi:hypothetical protein